MTTSPAQSGTLPTKTHTSTTRDPGFVALPIAMSALLIFSANYSFLLFHTLAELFSIVVAVLLSVVAWQMYFFTKNNFLVFLGSGYFWVGVLDLMHTLAYKGMNIFPSVVDSNPSVQLWLGSRYLESSILLCAPLFLTRTVSRHMAFAVFAVIAIAIFTLVMNGNFPLGFIEGQGLTAFKINSEYVIITLLAVAISMLWQRRNFIEPGMLKLMIASIVLTMGAELAFTFYVSVYGLSNIVGHIFKLCSYWLIYVAVVRTCLQQPFTAMARDVSTYEAIPDATLAIDNAGIIYQANQASLALAGLERNKIVGKHCHAVLHPGSTPAAECPVCLHIQDRRPVDKLTLHHPQRDIWFEYTLAPVVTGREVTGMVQTVRDLTVQHKAEFALKEAYDSMENQVRARTMDLVTANNKLQELDRLKSMFIASMSHELRTPLNSIIGFTGIMLKGMTGTLNNAQNDQLGRVRASAQHLLALISDIIDISKIEAGRVEVSLEPVNLHQTMNEAMSNVKTLLDGRGIELHIEVPEDIDLHTDRVRLRQVLINILSNAAKYTEQGTIHVNAVREMQSIRIDVQDTGVGIDSKDMERLFEPFERVNNSLSVKSGGTGLGLYLTKKLLSEVLRGNIHATSNPGQGSCFTITLPTDQVSAGSEHLVNRSGAMANETHSYH